MYAFTTMEMQIKNHSEILLHTHFIQPKSQRLTRQRGKTNVELPTITLIYNWRIIWQSFTEENIDSVSL